MQTSRFPMLIGGLSAAFLILLFATGCSDDSGSSPTPPAAEATATPDIPVTPQELLAVADLIFPASSGNMYGVCGANGELSRCPVTARLAARLQEARITLCRCQNASDSRAMTATPAANGGTILVTLFRGSISFELTAVRENDRLLIDDQVCAGRGAETSIYRSAELCYSATSAPSPTPMPPSSGAGTPAPGGAVTGIAAIDRAMAAVRSASVSQLAALVHLEPTACGNVAGLGGPPECRLGEAGGTLVDVLYSSSCEGSYVRQDGVEPLLARFIEGEAKLAGVYRHNGLTRLYPASPYLLVYSFDTPAGSLARVLFVSDAGIEGVTFACGSSAKEWLDAMGLKEAILLPGR
jgi:hypothetical protein